MAASGRFPRGRANFSFTFSSAWKKQKSSAGGTYWYSPKDSVALSMGSKLVLVSDKDPFLPEAPAVSAPAGFSDFRRGLALSGWINNPSEPLNKFIGNLGLPIQIPAEDLFFGAALRPAGRDGAPPELPWELVFKIRAATTREAGAMLTIFSLARLFVRPAAALGGMLSGPGTAMSPQDAAALLFANAPDQDGSFLVLRTGPLDAKRIALLFDMFSVYSK